MHRSQNRSRHRATYSFSTPDLSNLAGSWPVCQRVLTRHRADLPQIFTHQQRVYLQPAQKVAAINMDCTNDQNVQLTYAQGRSEALSLMA